MKFWPFVTRRVHELALQAANDHAAYFEGKSIDLATQLTYFRARFERLNDEALYRANAISSPVTVEQRVPTNPVQLVAMAMARQEFESKPDA